MTDEATDTDQFGRRYDGETSVVSVDLVTPELEAMARAICIQNLVSTRQPQDRATVDSYWRSFVPEARAALLAIREPTDGMKRAGIEYPFDCADSYTAMIDHVLGRTDQ